MDACQTSIPSLKPQRRLAASQDSSPRSNQHMPSNPLDVKDVSPLLPYNGGDDLVNPTALGTPSYNDFSAYNEPEDEFFGVNFDDDEPMPDFDGRSLDMNTQNSPTIPAYDTQGIRQGASVDDATSQSSPHVDRGGERPQLQISSGPTHVTRVGPGLYDADAQTLSVPSASQLGHKIIPNEISRNESTTPYALHAVSPGGASPGPRLTITPWGAGEERDLHDDSEHDSIRHDLHSGRAFEVTRPFTLRPKAEDDILADPSTQHTAQHNPVPSGVNEGETNRTGIPPDMRQFSSAVEIPNFRDVERQKGIEERKQAVEEWRLSTWNCADEPCGHAHDASRPNSFFMREVCRRRAVSTGDIVTEFTPLRHGQATNGAFHNFPPYPKMESDLLEGQSVEACSDTMSIHENRLQEGVAYVNEHATQIGAQDISFMKLDRRYHDLPSFPSIVDTRTQPETAMAAMKKYNDAADNFSLLSLAATWGTRRCSEPSLADFESLRNGNFIKRLSFSKDKRDKKPSIKYFDQITDKVNNMVRRKSVSKTISRGQGEKRGRHDTPSDIRKESQTHLAPSDTTTSSSRIRPTSPRLDTNLGVGPVEKDPKRTESISATTPGVGLRLMSSIRRVRSRSETPKSDSVGLYSLWKAQGGPPRPNLTSPRFKPEEAMSLNQSDVDVDVNDDDEDDDDEDELEDDGGLTIVDKNNIIPNFAGFQEQIRRLNPHMSPDCQYLVDRIAHQQVNRYRTLTAHKVKHTQYVSNGDCPSGNLCNPVETVAGAHALHVHTSVDGLTSHGNMQAIDPVDGGFNPKDHFHSGIPVPPTKTFPAEFECALCFKVKASKKPSDWTKHVHEDVHPFTCTFLDCKDPKTFKRKADWVRHENELHRQLESWQCQAAGCDHQCFRKNNFLQHLIREHKFPEPKSKTKTAIKSACGLEQEVWNVVRNCHQQTKNKPQDEPCKFCGKAFGSWKRLTVHLAKHMEHISLSVLQLVKQQEYDASTNARPLEVLPEGGEPAASVSMDRNYGMSATSSQFSHNTGVSPSSYDVSQLHTPVRMSTPSSGYTAQQFPGVECGSLPDPYECPLQPADGRDLGPISMTELLQEDDLLNNSMLNMMDMENSAEEPEAANFQASYTPPNHNLLSNMMAMQGQGGFDRVTSQRRISNPFPVSSQSQGWNLTSDPTFSMKSHLGVPQQTGAFPRGRAVPMVGSAPLTRSSSRHTPSQATTSPNPQHVDNVFGLSFSGSAILPPALAPDPALGDQLKHGFQP